MNKKKLKYLVLAVCVCCFYHTKAQYLGGVGKGDGIQTLLSLDLNGTTTLDKINTGGSGKGDAFASSANYNSFIGLTSDLTSASNWLTGSLPSGVLNIINTGVTQPVLTGNYTLPTGTTITINNGASLTVTPTGVLTVNGTLTNDGTLTLQSNATGTASIGNSTGTITGNVTAERYVPAVARRWRNFAPATTNFTYNQLIDDIFITGPSAGVGFDASAHVSNPSVFTYQESTSGGRGWKTVNNISNTLSNGSGCIVFIRGDRTLSSPQWYTAPFVAQNEVTLDVTGPVTIGSDTIPLSYTNTNDVAEDGWNLVGNPYPSPIDWSAVSKTNISSFYYILDPQTGAYAVSDVGAIASGQSFFVKATASGASIIFNESNKTSSGVAYFKSTTTPFTVKLIKDSITSDIALLKFDSSYSIGYNPNEDALKMLSGLTNVSFVSGNHLLHVNAVPDPMPSSTDSFYLSINAPVGAYKLDLFNFVGLPTYKQCFITDTWQNKTALLSADSSFTFDITSNALSSGKRYLITLKPNSALPVDLLSFTGYQVKDKGNVLTWKTATEKNTSHFLVERLAEEDATFTSIGLVKASGNKNTISVYNYTDMNSQDLNGTVLYRLKIVDYDGSYHYSKVIALKDGALEDRNMVTTYPNPVSLGEEVQIMYTDYNLAENTIVSIYDATGTLVRHYPYKVNTVRVVDMDAGVYYLEVNSGNHKQVIKLIVL